MEQQDTLGMLDLIIHPAFCVKDGVVVRLNKAAESHLIEVNTPVAQLLATGQEEYAEFTEGCLYLTLNLSNAEQGASVVRMNGFDVFLLEQDADQSELRAMALAAQSLREPLSSVMTIADRLFPVIEQTQYPATREQIARINRGLFQMLRILGNMSDADRYRNTAPFPQETRDICALLAELFGKVAAMHQHTGIDVQFQNLHESVYCLVDVEKLERGVYNIISNAMKFTPKGGYIHAKLSRRGNRLYLTVQDSGKGIPENQRSSVYHRFLREPGIEDTRHGIGLGMVLIRAAAAAHNGTVLIEQPKEQGMRITLTMEIRQNTESTVRSPGLKVDYAGEWDHSLIELADALPAELYLENPEN